MAEPNELKEMYERMRDSQTYLSTYQTALNQAATDAGLEARIRESAIPDFQIDWANATQEQKAQYAATLAQYDRKKAIKTLKSNIEGIIDSTDQDKLLASAIRIKSDSKGPFAKTFTKYKTYIECLQAITTDPNSIEDANERAKLIESKKKVPEVYKELVERRIKEYGKCKDKEDIQFWTKVVMSLSQPEYMAKAISNEAQKIETKLKKLPTTGVKQYILAGLKKDEDYLRFGERLHQMYNSREEN